MSVPRGLRNNNPGNIRLSKDKWQGLRERQEDKDGCQGRYDAYLCTYGCVLAFRAG